MDQVPRHLNPAAVPRPSPPVDYISRRQLFGELCNRLDRAVFHYIHGKIRDRHKAQDLTQRVFLKAWKSGKAIDPRTSGTAWLFKIADRVVIDHLREEGAQKRAAAKSLESTGARGDVDWSTAARNNVADDDPDCAPPTRAIKNERDQFLQAALEQLRRYFKT